MKMKQHVLKTDPEYFEAAASGSKTFEIRRNDRDFQVGDLLTLRETVHTAIEMSAGAPLEYTGRDFHAALTYVMPGYDDGAIGEGWAILGFKKAKAWSDAHLIQKMINKTSKPLPTPC